MVVDDESDITTALQIGLEARSLEVGAYNDPELVLSNFRPGLYDLVLVDVMMPKVDSFELYERIKKVNPDVKVCFLTDSEMYYEKIGGAKYYTLNKEMFLLKPISTRSKKENKQQDKLHLIGNRGIK